MGKLIRSSFKAMTKVERTRVTAMYAFIIFLHVLGFGLFFVYVVPGHYRAFGMGLSITAYTLGLRHAFDADHISAIDNTTRKVLGERQGTGKPRPFSFGFWFSLGHSTIVMVMGVGLIIAEKTVLPAVTNQNSGLEMFGGIFGTIVSALFLFLIGGLNWVVLVGIMKVFRSMRRGTYDEAELEKQLQNRGFFARFFGKWMRIIDKEWQLYPVGVVFGLGFDTATEVLLLTTTAFLASEHVPWQAIIALPILFMAGMCIMDTTDGIFMNVAYGWAFFNPVRKVYYNLAMTGLSIFICFFIAAIEVLSLVPQELHVSANGGFWGFINAFNLNTAGFVIVGVFILTWVAAVLIWKYGNIEEKWGANIRSAPAASAADESVTAVEAWAPLPSASDEIPEGIPDEIPEGS
jgi:high-affinity nickel-transport protein